MTTQTPHSPEWRLEEAKAKFSQVVEQALAGTPQKVTRRGKSAVVVVSAEKWEALNGTGPKAIELFRNAPKLTEEECAEFEGHLDRGQLMLQDRDIDFD
jgi:antitoxin Phd